MILQKRLLEINLVNKVNKMVNKKPEKRKEYAGTELFKQFYRTGEISNLFEGYREYMSVNSTGFIDQLRSANREYHFENEFMGVEYEMILNAVVRKKPAVMMSPIPLAESVRRTFNRSRKYLVDGVLPRGFADVLYVGGEKELFLYEEGAHRKIKIKNDLDFIINRPENALVKKRGEANNSVFSDDALLTAGVAAGKNGYEFVGRAQKGKVDVSVLDVRSGRVYVITASETTANKQRLYQVEVEYKGFISPFKVKRNVHGGRESEDEIVDGIVDIGLHVQNKIRFDKPWTFTLHPTSDTKYDFVKLAYASRIDKEQVAHLDAMGLAGLAAKQ